MSGLIREEIVRELRVEVSWIINAIVELSDHFGFSSYATCLLRNRVEPEEARSIERIIFTKWKNLESTSLRICVHLLATISLSRRKNHGLFRMKCSKSL